MKTWKKFLVFFLMFAIFSCSDDDSLSTDNGPDPDPVAETQTGVFRDSEVAGLFYETETKSGFTDSNGKFEYLEGETVTFYVGDIKIGSGPASEDMTPISIASTDGATIDSSEVKNIAAFLQTLDSDNDPSNGISISEETAAAISLNAIDFTQPIEKVLGEIVAEVNLATGAALRVVYPEEAALHLAETTGETYEPGIDIFRTFIPTLESWKTYPSTAVYWIHETNAEGDLVSSIMYEKYPERILYKIDYVELKENGLPLDYTHTYYRYGEQGTTINVEVSYNDDLAVARFYRTNTDGSFNQDILFTQLDEENRIVEAEFYSESNEFWYREVYDLLDNGNNNTRTRYSSQSGNDESAIQYKEIFSYTDFGEIESWTPDNRMNSNGVFTWNYGYRANHTMETRERASQNLGGTDRTDKYFYDHEERVERLIIEVGDYVSDYVEFYSNGQPKKVETYYLGFLYEIIEWAEDRTSIWKTIEEDGSYKIEYRDENEVVLKTEYYDADGNLTSTDG